MEHCQAELKNSRYQGKRNFNIPAVSFLRWPSRVLTKNVGCESVLAMYELGSLKNLNHLPRNLVRETSYEAAVCRYVGNYTQGVSLYTLNCGVATLLWGCTDRCIKPDLHACQQASFQAVGGTDVFLREVSLEGRWPGRPPPRLQAPPDLGDRYGSGSGSGREGVLLAGTLGLWARLPAAGRGGRARGHSGWTLLDPVSEEVLLPFQETEDAAAALGVTAAGRSPQGTGPGAGRSSHTQKAPKSLTGDVGASLVNSNLLLF